jgi:hypothetical protein
VDFLEKSELFQLYKFERLAVSLLESIGSGVRAKLAGR